MARWGRREGLARFAAPAAFLAAVTVAVLLIRAGLHGGGSSPPSAPVASVAVTDTIATTEATAPEATTTAPAPKPAPRRRYYVIQAGDTFSIIAARLNTTVERLRQLNPGVSSNALRIGQRIRVQ